MNIDKLNDKFKKIKKINDSTNLELNNLINKLEEPKKSFTPEIFKYDNTSTNYLDNIEELYGLFICMFLIEDYLKRLDLQMNVYDVD